MPNSNTIDWFEIAKFISEIVLSALTVAISLFALYQTKRQIKLSNKHQLFDRRLENYNIVVDLISCFYTAVLICDDESNIDEYSTIILQALLDNSYFEDAKWVIEDTLNEKAIETIRKKGRWLYKVSKEIPIIFNTKEAELISRFVHWYGLLIDNLNNYNYWKSFSDEIEKQEEIRKSVSAVYRRTIKILNQIDETNAMNMLLEEIKLT